MFLFGTELFFAFWMASKSVGLPSRSAPPVRAATSMFLISFAKSLPRLASITAFLCFVVAHLEWPDICLSPSRNPSLYEPQRSYRDSGQPGSRAPCRRRGRAPGGRRSVPGGTTWRGRCPGVRRRCGRRARRAPRPRRPTDSTQGARMKTPSTGPPSTPCDVDRRLEGLVLPAEGVAAHDHVDAADGLLARARVEDLVGEHDHAGAGAVDGHARRARARAAAPACRRGRPAWTWWWTRRRG